MSSIASGFEWLTQRLLKPARVRVERPLMSTPQRAFGQLAGAAGAGNVETAFQVGERYLEGEGVTRSPVEAARWYQRAAKAGHLTAQVRLVQLHLLGLSQSSLTAPASLFDVAELGEADHYAALPWALRAAKSGSADAQAMLAYILSSGPEDLRDADGAFTWYRKSAEQDCPQGRLGYAVALMSRAADGERVDEAHDHLVRAAGAGLPVAHYLLGTRMDSGSDEGGQAGAREHYSIAAEAGCTSAQLRLGVMQLEGRGGPADPQSGESWLRRASLGGDSEAAARLADIYSHHGALPPNYVEAAQWLRIAAERGHRRACHALGTRYLNGVGVARDLDEAAMWFKRSAEAGDAYAQAELAALLQSGMVPAMQAPPVQEWFERAAKGGDLIGAYNYAVCLAEGIGVERNDELAVHWLKRAAEGVVDAQYWYGRMLAEGRGVARNYAEADAWFTRAAHAGHSVAALMCARHAATNDTEAAIRWYELAASLGDVEAKTELAAIGGLKAPPTP